MTTLGKIQAVTRMYLLAAEDKNEDRLDIMAKRANDLYRETYGTEYSMKNIRENILFCMAHKETSYYFLEDLREVVNELKRF